MPKQLMVGLCFSAVLIVALFARKDHDALALADAAAATDSATATERLATSTATATATATVRPTTTPTLIPTAATPPSVYLPLLYKQELITPTLRNGNFENGLQAWSESSSEEYRLIFMTEELSGTVPHSGEWAAWLGGIRGEISVLSQETIVPEASPFLQYWSAILPSPNCDRDLASIVIDSVQLAAQYSLCVEGSQPWSVKTVDLSRYAGKVVWLEFRVELARGSNSSLFLDDIEWVESATPVE